MAELAEDNVQDVGHEGGAPRSTFPDDRYKQKKIYSCDLAEGSIRRSGLVKENNHSARSLTKNEEGSIRHGG